VGSKRQHTATLTLREVGLIGLQRLWTPKRNQNTLTALQATEGSVIHPVRIDPKAVDPS
jgi:hypothetical protein